MLAQNNKAISQSARCILGEVEAARYTGFSRPYLRLLRQKGGGPAFLKVGRAVRYDTRDLDAWLDSHRVVR